MPLSTLYLSSADHKNFFQHLHGLIQDHEVEVDVEVELDVEVDVELDVELEVDVAVAV